MNPFDLRGPPFLAFYTFLGAVSFGLMILRRRLMEPGGTVEGRLADPGEIAYLRGGPREAVAVSVLSLLERGALKSVSDCVVGSGLLPEGALTPLDDAVHRSTIEPRRVFGLVDDARVAPELDRLRGSLEEKGLLPDAVQKGARWISAIVAIGLMGGVAAMKVNVALARGKHNVGFLIALWVVFTALLLWKASPFRTPRGNRTLADLESLLAHVKRRPPRAKDAADAAYATPDLLMLAAVYGMTSLPWSVRTHHASVIPQAAVPSSGSGTSSSCGAGGTSSCGSGSSCGGGGGGCGGCGGGGGD
jgi:uncharacterized protein (TIGR04222 family)